MIIRTPILIDFRYICFFVLATMFFTNQVSAQNKIKLTSNHTDAVFSKIDDSDIHKFTPLGEGEISFKLDKNSINKVMVAKEGYEPVILEFPKTEKYEKELKVLLLNRMVEVESNHEDATVQIGDQILGKGKSKVVIREGETAEVTINKSGYVSKTATYYNSPEKAIPPVKEIFELRDRYVQIDENPKADFYLLNGQKMPEGTTGIVIPYEECVELKIVKSGYANVIQNFCNRAENDDAPPIIYKANMEDRVVKFAVIPADASIQVNGAAQAFGQYDLLLPKGRCLKVEISKEGFISYVQTYCNQTEEDNQLAIAENINLIEDEAYLASIYSDKVNHRIPIAVRKSLSTADAWKILISIITKEYDVLETVDYNAGYLITAWQYDGFNKDGKTIRSRIIITNSGSTTENNYAVKFVSQTGEGNAADLEDTKYTDWNRILRKYYDLLEDMEIRLQ
ncbi:MAG TPA: hypothetical protein VK921_03285 [Anditalea sp.]|nr:hypothetical protein [Anditalea sp.]